MIDTIGQLKVLSGNPKHRESDYQSLFNIINDKINTSGGGRENREPG